MQNTGASISGIKPQSIIKVSLSGPFQLGEIGQMRFTVKRIPLGETLLHRDFQADLHASRKMVFSAENRARDSIIYFKVETSFSPPGKATVLPIMWIS